MKKPSERVWHHQQQQQFHKCNQLFKDPLLRYKLKALIFTIMVKLDVSLLRYLTPVDFKVLVSVEMGMRNHELVPKTLVTSIATLRYGGCAKHLADLTKHKLLAHENLKNYEGYRLTYAGYDYLALNALTHREVLGGVGNQIGVGKESDVFICESPDQKSHYAIKFHRLGRVCFRKVSEKRDFYTKSKSKTSWIYLSRKAAQREFEFLRFMYCKGMPVPKPIDWNRHVVVMELVGGRILNHYNLDSFEPEKRDRQVAQLYKKLMDLIFRFANETRVIHGDFNEFNIIIKHDEEADELVPVIIDLPQMISIDHDLAPEQFERDINCIVDFFIKRFNYESDYVPKWEDIEEKVQEEGQMDKYLQCLLTSIGNDQEDADDTRQDDYLKELESADKMKPQEVKRDELCNNNHSQITRLNNQSASDDDEETKSAHSDLGSVNENELMDDIDDCVSQFTTMTVNPLDARKKLQTEMFKKESNRRRREAAKPRNTKGDSNPVRRRRKTNNHVVAEDTAAFQDYGV